MGWIWNESQSMKIVGRFLSWQAGDSHGHHGYEISSSNDKVITMQT